MNKRGLILGVIIIGILLVVGFFWFVDEWNSGEDKGECVKVKTTCCPCNMGGKEKCVLVSEAERYKNNLSECSEGLICAAVYNCKIESCEYVEGECVGA